jgi:hypothetical protein
MRSYPDDPDSRNTRQPPDSRSAPPPRQRAKLINWRPFRRNTLLGFAAVRMPSGLEFYEVPVHVSGSRAWAAPPGRPWIDANGVAVRGQNGKDRYQAVIGFASHGVRSRWSGTIIDALLAEYPDALNAEVPARTEPEPEPAGWYDDRWPA